MKENKIYISFYGSIGVGKTTTGTALQERMKDAVFIPEEVSENVYLDRFYAEPAAWGFLSTLEMLLLMANQFQKIPPQKDVVILDNGIAELICYASYEYKTGILSEEQFSTYQRLYRKMLELTPEVDLYVYFHCSTEKQAERIQKRGRSCEQNIDNVFLDGLREEYEKWTKTLPKERLLVIDTENGVDLEKTEREIRKKIRNLYVRNFDNML